MLGTTGGRFLGPSGSQPHRNLWPLHSGRGLDFQTNGEGMYHNYYCVIFLVVQLNIRNAISVHAKHILCSTL